MMLLKRDKPILYTSCVSLQEDTGGFSIAYIPLDIYLLKMQYRGYFKGVKIRDTDIPYPHIKGYFTPTQLDHLLHTH